MAFSGKAIDIWFSSRYPANTLSNLYPNAFEFGGIDSASFKSLKIKDKGRQKQICLLSGKAAKTESIAGWQTTQTIYWKGQPINRQSQEFTTLINRTYHSLFEQNATLRKALLSTKGKQLYHTHGLSNPSKTILAEK